MRAVMDAFLPQDVRRNAYGQAVWFRSPDAGIKFAEMIGKRWWLKSPAHQGERGVSRKAIAQGMPDCSALPDDLWASFPFSPRGLRVQLAPGIPCALCFSRVAADKARAFRAAGMRKRALATNVARVSEAIPGVPMSLRSCGLRSDGENA